MKNISTNKLQNQLSKVIREVEDGEVYQVARYSKPVAFLISSEKYEELVSKSNCKACMDDLRHIAGKLKNQKSK